MLGRIRTASTAARLKGTLFSIETDHKLIGGETGDPIFFVSIAKNLVRKDEATAAQLRKQKEIESQRKQDLLKTDEAEKSGGSDRTKSKNLADGGKPAFNPFLPYEPSMFVEDVGNSHVLLLNKFNVVENHVLLVTKQFEPQSSLLTAVDHEALWSCLVEFSALAFYNAGSIAGASQPHKHLQLIPTPLGMKTNDINEKLTPMDNMFKNVIESNSATSVKGLEFVHAVAGVKDCMELAKEGRLKEAGEISMERYLTLLRVANSKILCSEKGNNSINSNEGHGVQPYAYNLLVTRKWMMIVPRRRAGYKGVAVNALGFAGCLLVRTNEALEILIKEGGMKVLRETGFEE